MSPQESVQLFVAIQTLVVGLSHALQPRAWVDFFIYLRSKGHTGVFANGFLSLWFGGIIVAFHNVWSGPEMVITLLGWAQMIKGTIAFLIPSLSMRGFMRVSQERSHEYVIAGVAFIAFSGLCWYIALWR